MDGLDLLSTQEWKPLSSLGFHNPFFSFDVVTITNTWIMLGMLCIILVPIRLFFFKKPSVIRFLVTLFISSFANLCEQTIGFFSFGHFSFITALFIFILMANCLMLIPYLVEPTQNINTTLSLGIIVFFYIQISAVRAHGVRGYLKEYFVPIFLMFPLHVIGKLATIVSMSFRLFGNIFGGATISHIYFGAIKGSILWELFGILPGLVVTIFFGIFEGFLQAFVFTMLALTYLSIALQEEHESQKELS